LERRGAGGRTWVVAVWAWACEDGWRGRAAALIDAVVKEVGSAARPRLRVCIIRRGRGRAPPVPAHVCVAEQRGRAAWRWVLPSPYPPPPPRPPPVARSALRAVLETRARVRVRAVHGCVVFAVGAVVFGARGGGAGQAGARDVGGGGQLLQPAKRTRHGAAVPEAGACPRAPCAPVCVSTCAVCASVCPRRACARA
jgi:hypothetical protein